MRYMYTTICVYTLYILYIYYTTIYIYLLYIYHSHTHWSNLFEKLLLMNDFHSSLLTIKVLSSSICSHVSSMSWPIYVFCSLPLLLFPFVGTQKSMLYPISS